MVTAIQPRTGRECPDCDAQIDADGSCRWCFFGDSSIDDAHHEAAASDLAGVQGVEGCVACYGDPEACDDPDYDCDGFLFGDGDEP